MQEATVRRVLGYTRRIAVVGASASPWRPSNDVASALLGRGYGIVPVNPNYDEVLGLTCYPSLGDVPGDIDLVDVFRREEFLADVARQAVEVGARGLWMQLGLRSSEARATAEEAGLDVVEDLCLKVEVGRHAGEMQLPPAAA